MKHDIEHEMKQDEAIRMLAGAVASVAAAAGQTDLIRVVAHIQALIAADEAEPEEVKPVASEAVPEATEGE